MSTARSHFNVALRSAAIAARDAARAAETVLEQRRLRRWAEILEAEGRGQVERPIRVIYSFHRRQA